MGANMSNGESDNGMDDLKVSPLRFFLGRQVQAWDQLLTPKPIKDLLQEEKAQKKRLADERQRANRINVRGGLKELAVILRDLENEGRIDHITDQQAADLFTVNGNDVNAGSLKTIRNRDMPPQR
jgi:hypothetical protein